MSWVAAAVIGGSIIGGAIQSEAQKSVAESAAKATISAAEKSGIAQKEALQLGIEEQRARFNEIKELMSPYIEAGETALIGQMDLLGLGEEGSQAKIIEQIQQSPEFQALKEQGETSILQRASATGGLRGGNVQEALGQFSPNLLSNLINQRFQQFSGVSGRGQNAAGQVGQFGQTATGNITNLISGGGLADARAAELIGSAQAAENLAKGQATANIGAAISSIPSTFVGLRGGKF